MSERIFSRDAFAAALRTTFRVQPDGGAPIELELVEVSALRETPKQEMYSIVFRGPLDVPLPQRLYRMHHAQMGTVELFLVPIGVDGQGYSYEAVFNHLKRG